MRLRLKRIKKVRPVPLIILSLICFGIHIQSLCQDNDTMALLIIDVQQFYFPGGASPLVNPEKASLNAGRVLEGFREKGLPVIHIRHNARTDTEIHPNVAPAEGEKVISKDEANSFNGTELFDYLTKKGITDLVICGMMTHMCVEATTRAAYDLGFKCTVVEDACTTRDLKYADVIIKARDVHLSTLSSLSGFYARITDTESFLSSW